MPKHFTDDAIHKLKEANNFDGDLLQLLVPPGHRMAAELQATVLADSYRAALSSAVNPAVCDFFTDGYSSVIRAIHKRKNIPGKVRYSLSGEVRAFLHSFVGRVHDDAKIVLPKTQRHKLNRYIEIVVEEAIRHSRIVVQLRKH